MKQVPLSIGKKCAASVERGNWDNNLYKTGTPGDASKGIGVVNGALARSS
jgi:hypothetical protein